MIEVLVISLEGFITKKENLSFVDLIFLKKIINWMPKMTVLMSIVSIVVRRVITKSTVRPRRQTKVTKAIGIRFTVYHVKIPERMCPCVMNARQLNIMYRAVSSS